MEPLVKQKIKENWQWLLAWIILMITIINYVTTPECRAGRFSYEYEGEQVIIEGNKAELERILDDIIGERIMNLTELRRITDEKDDRITNCPQTTMYLPCPDECKPCPECPKTQCPKCPVCKQCTPDITKTTTTIKQTKTQEEILKNLRPTKSNSAAFSGGFFDCKTKVLDILGIKGSKFKEGPSTGWYKALYGKTITDELICFPDLSRGQTKSEFKLNNSIWLISGNGSMKTIYKKI